ncbi:carboxymuconolactone decarboxylase family protein [Streptomyces roseirectus]|uniref:Carboxymuconolactone decarboxylase family protein n=1 Tax=Streptomyces roseirectus TaxID=2768066 RepID=A0A7H0I948_9ACTN|nr:carboxymuconolactone decarboxylase family protein [Streptomyces roseirectus]QNP69314.1 carboxymuconolactone decarboxylase family protein [Streptomyces roseirectus]
MTTPFRHTTPPSPKAAEGRVAEAYAQIARDFGITAPPTFVVLSSAPELMLPAWALLRESLIAGPGDRTGKEVAAYGVSLANRCPFCVSAHTVLLHATGDHALAERLARGERPESDVHARVLDWAIRTRVPGADLGPLPFAREERAGYFGTVLTFHFVNRFVSALLTGDLLPAGAQRLRPMRSLTGRALSRTVRREAVPGASLPLLRTPAEGPDGNTRENAANSPCEGPSWASGTPVAPAYAALRTAALTGADLLTPDERSLVEAAVAAWDGAHPPVILRGYPHRRELPAARLALLSALAPYRITADDVAAWREHAVEGDGTDKSGDGEGDGRTDRDLVRLVAYGAFLAVERAEATLNFSPAPARHI